MPFPNEETTPPVTQINRVISDTVGVSWSWNSERRGCEMTFATALPTGRQSTGSTLRIKAE